MIPQKLKHGDNLASLFERFNAVIDYLREIRLVAGSGIRLNKLSSGLTIESTATASASGIVSSTGADSQWQISVSPSGEDFFVSVSGGQVLFRERIQTVSGLSFTLKRTDLPVVGDTIYVCVTKKVRSSTSGPSFSLALTKHYVSNFLTDDHNIWMSVGGIRWSEADQSPVPSVYQNGTIIWPDFFGHSQIHFDLGFDDLPAVNGAYFVDFLSADSGTKQYLRIDGNFAVIFNGITTSSTDFSSLHWGDAFFRMDTQTGSNLYLYWTCSWSTDYRYPNDCALPKNAHFEFKNYIDSQGQQVSRRRNVVSIPLVSFSRYSSSTSMLGFYMMTRHEGAQNVPLYSVNTFGSDFYPYGMDGWITIDTEHEYVHIEGIRCYGNGSLIGTIVVPNTPFVDHRLPWSGEVNVRAVYDAANRRWGTPYLTIGNTAVTTDSSGVTGTLISWPIANIRGSSSPADASFAQIQQNYAGPVHLISYEYEIAQLKSTYDYAISQINDRLDSIDSTIVTILEWIRNHPYGT